MRRSGVLIFSAVMVASGCAGPSGIYRDPASAATLDGRQYLGVDRSAFLAVDSSRLAEAGRIEQTTDDLLDPVARRLDGIPVELAFVGTRRDGTYVVFVSRDRMASGETVGRSVPELCAILQDRAAEGCP
jgi:hypothetical protein